MANLTLKEKFLAVTNAKRVTDGEPILLMTDIDFGTPEAYSGSRSPRTNRIYLTPKASSIMVGRATVYFDKIDLATITSLAVVKGAATTIAELLPQINDEMGVALEVTDIVPGALPGSGTTFTLTASAGNLLFKNATTVTFTT